MAITNIIMVNNSVGCGTQIQQQTEVTTDQSYLIQLVSISNAVGPFSIFTGTTGSTPLYSGITRIQMISGLTITI